MIKKKLPLALAVALFASPALAITDEEGTSAIQFNFANPGARSLAMGGAFLGLADDATAAYANPAGLTQLSRREFAAEWRRTNFSTPYLSDGTHNNPATARYDYAKSHVSGPSFLSAVFPFERASLALYRHEAADFRTRFSYASVHERPEALAPYDSQVDLKNVTLGASLGYALNERWHLGAGVSRHDFRIDSSTTRQWPEVYEGLHVVQSQRGEDHGLGYVLGVRYLPTDRLTLGLSYRHGPRMAYDVRNEMFWDDESHTFIDKKAYFVGPEESAYQTRANTIGRVPAAMSEANTPNIQAQKAAIQRISQRRL